MLCLPLFGYQLRWLDDWSRFKIINKSRQIGITFVETLDLVQRCVAKKQKWYYLSVSRERAKEAIDYAKKHALAMGQLFTHDEDAVFKFERVKYRAQVITFPNGSQIIALPACGRTARGASGNLVLDEFAHHVDAAAIWTAVNAILTWGFHVHVISTPNGQQGEFFAIWTNDRQRIPEAIEDDIRAGRDPLPGDIWSRHLVNIHDAKADGHPVDIEVQRQLARTDSNWQQEYLCQFLDESFAWLPYSLIDACTTARATLEFDSTQPPTGPLYQGYDVGRKHDLAVLWINEQLSDEKTITRAVITLEQQRFAVQQRVLFDSCGQATRTHIDAQGIGAQLAEQATERFGEQRVEGIASNNASNARLASHMREHFEKNWIEIPDDESTRRDLHMVRREYTDAGKVKFDAPRTKDGHADRFWACGLALDAQSNGHRALRASDITHVGQLNYERDNVDRGDFGGF